MAYSISDEKLLRLLITDTDYCLFYYRARVRDLLPTLVRSHLLVIGVEEEITERLGLLIPDNRDPECVERWPECEDGMYDPRCCRFPKSCSCSTKVSNDTTKTTPIQSTD